MAKKSAPQPEEQPAPPKAKKGTVKPINDAVEEFNRGPILPRG
jgi:hypothetical protein